MIKALITYDLWKMKKVKIPPECGGITKFIIIISSKYH